MDIQLKHFIVDKDGKLHVYVVIDGVTYYISVQKFLAPLL